MGEPTADDGAAKPVSEPADGSSPNSAEDSPGRASPNRPEASPGDELAWRALARRMVREQLESRGIRDRRVLEAMAEVPRHQFVGRVTLRDAYCDRALPTLEGQTISQPYMVAVMTELLHAEPGMWVLEIGTGSGYQAAVLAEMDCRVVTVERVSALVRIASKRLEKLGYADRIRVVGGDGSAGLPPDATPPASEGEALPGPATFDRILVTASAPTFHPSLARLLVEGGRAIIPIGSRRDQELHVINKRQGRLETSTCIPCRFVPLIGTGGWSGGQDG